MLATSDIRLAIFRDTLPPFSDAAFRHLRCLFHDCFLFIAAAPIISRYDTLLIY